MRTPQIGIIIVVTWIYLVQFGDMKEPQNDLLGAMATAGYSFFVKLIQDSHLTSDITNAESYTILLPNREAFDKLKDSFLLSIQKEPERLGALIKGHIIPKILYSSDLTDGRSEQTLLGDYVQFNLTRGLSVNGSNVIRKDIVATNGIIHIIDDVIAFDSIKKMQKLQTINEILNASRYSMFQSLLNEIGFANVLLFEAPFTLFVPSNEAFSEVGSNFSKKLIGNSSLLRYVLFHHIVKGRHLLIRNETLSLRTIGGQTLNLLERAQGYFVNDTRIKLRNQEASDGVVHEIARVILPTTREAILYPQGEKDERIFNKFLKTLKRLGLTAFSTLIVKAQLSRSLSGEDLFTVFVPTNEAFSRLSIGLVSQLKSNPTLMKQFLLQHVVKGQLSANRLRQGWIGKSLDGSRIHSYQRRTGEITVKGATILERDIKQSKFIIHSLDKVLLPIRNKKIL